MTNKTTKTTLTIEETEKIADLAKLPLSEKEKKLFCGQLTEILDFVESISEVNTEEVSPLSNVLGLKNVFREDEVTSEGILSQEEAVSGSDKVHNGYFKVGAILSERSDK